VRNVLDYRLQNRFPYAGPVGSQRQGDGRWHGPAASAPRTPWKRPRACSGRRAIRTRPICDLEQATGLNRSSLYAAFDTKQAIFELALESYLRSFIEPRLAPVERAEADAGDIERFFTGLAGFFRTGSQARQGCLMINSIAEHEGRSTRLGRRAQAFRDRLDAAFANAMAGRHEPGLAGERAQLLTATTLGIWLTARIDPAGAAQACDAAAACIRTWQQAPAGHGGG
jgi:TetR/AcrR family transcriptional regulator, transcriptional repressor for nem operon